MKNLARLALFFSVCFAALFLLAAGVRFLFLRLEWVRTLPQHPEIVLDELIAACRWALSLTIYSALLLSMSYAVREHVFAPAAALCLFVLSLGFCFGITLALEQWGNVPQARSSVQALGGPGLILTNDIGPSETAIVLLRGPAEPDSPRVAAIPGRPLLYQAEPAGPGAFSLPPVPFKDDSPWFLKSLAIDLRLSAGELRRRFEEGLPAFLMYAGTLIFFLCSLGFILKLSAWPLANLFLACLAFRGVLALEIFFNSPEIQDAFDSFFKSRLPLAWVVPLIFCALGILVYLYSFLTYLAHRRSGDEL